MPITRTPNAGLAKPSDLMQGWGTVCNSNADLLDGLAAIGGFACVSTGETSARPFVHILVGQYRWIEFFAGERFNSEMLIYLDPYCTKYVNAIWNVINPDDAYPIGQSFIPIAKVTTDNLFAAVIEDERCPYLMTGFTYLIALNYADDAAAATAGVQVGELYHTSGAVKIRRN